MPSDQQPETVQAYLSQLRHALKGAPRGLIADALADCEEHLNNEIAQNPQLNERMVLAAVIKTYGSPQEIAEEYRTLEATLSTPFPRRDEKTDTSLFSHNRPGLFTIITDPRSYGALLYMLMALFTGIFYFVWSVIGIAITAGMSVLIFGIPFALLFIASVRVIGHIEGRIVEGLLGVRMPRRLPSPPHADGSLWERIKDAVTDMRTWTSLLYLLLMLPLGIFYFTLAITGLALSLGMSGVAVYGLITRHLVLVFDPYPPLAIFFNTPPGLVLAALLGALLFFFILHMARALGWIHARIAEGLLVRL